MIRFWSILIAVAALTADADAGEPLRTVTAESGVSILAGDVPILHYQRAIKSLDGKWPRANYVHPLYGLDGSIITEDFPADHGHHRGVFWAWHQVWVGDKKLGDAWLCKDFIWDIQSVETSSDGESQSIVASVLWKSPDHVDETGQLIPVVRESTSITVHQDREHERLIDFEVSLFALVDDVKIGGSEDVKGYGGFSPRIKLHSQQSFVSAAGEIEPVKTAIDAGSWINIADKTNGIAILSSSNNPPPNDRWILRSKNSMQNAVYPGREPVALSKLEPTVLKYRLVIHRGDLSSEKISQLRVEFDQPAND